MSEPISGNVTIPDHTASNHTATNSTEEDMPNAPDGDLSFDSLELLLEQELAASDALMTEVRGNAASANSIVRHSGARKFNQEDPIEAAAAEMILQKNTP